MAARTLFLSRPLPGVDGDALAEFIRQSQPWTAERVPLPARLRWALWILIPIDLIWGFWLGTIAGINPCESRFCKVATLDGNAPVLLGCAGVSLIGLVAVAISTRGLAEVDGREVAGLYVSTITGGAALLGIAVLVIALLVIAIVVAAFIAAFTFTP
jgi:hypothetical protein